MRSDAVAPRSDSFTLFVYGTLMRGQRRHGVLSGQAYRGEARTRPHYALFDLGAYPGLARCDRGGRSIRGELYEVATSMRACLDAIEGAPSLFRLEPVSIEGCARAVLAYFYQRDTSERSPLEGDRWTRTGEQ